MRRFLLGAGLCGLLVMPGASGPRILQTSDGSVLVAIPGGAFTMGSEERDERPRHYVTLKPFYIGRVPVTNSKYSRFEAATRYRTAGDWQRDARMWGDQAPVVKVNWHDARAYCRWARLRLPTEAERERAARGTDGRKFPWGDRFERGKCHSSVGMTAGGIGGATAVGQYPQGVSPDGCFDMAGNVWEWTSSLYLPYPYVADDGREDVTVRGLRVIRGSSWLCNDPYKIRTTYRLGWNMTSATDATGFRVARDF